MKLRTLRAAATLAFTLLLPAFGYSQNAESAPPAIDPLAPFQKLMGGQWHLDGSYQEFEWGVGRLSVKGRSYFFVDGMAKLVSEGAWFWHPGEKQIRGIFTAVDMPVQLFDYTTRFVGGNMVNNLRAYSAEGIEAVYEETWEFTDEGHFEWTLWNMAPEGRSKAMGGTYTKK